MKINLYRLLVWCSIAFVLIVLSFNDSALSADDPRNVVAEVVERIRPQKSSLSNADLSDRFFRKKMIRYMTDEFISAIEYGRDCCPGKEINLYDAELFTGVQGLTYARLGSATIIQQTKDSAIVSALVEYDGDIEPPPKYGEHEDIIFKLKRKSGSWKIDDVINHWTKKRESVKNIFSNPEKYGVVFVNGMQQR